MADQDSEKLENAYRSLLAIYERKLPKAAIALQKSQASWVEYLRDQCEYLPEYLNGLDSSYVKRHCISDERQARLSKFNLWLSVLRKRYPDLAR
jgi:uncharacterized protein YecT (DUF1311 family)